MASRRVSLKTQKAHPSAVQFRKQVVHGVGLIHKDPLPIDPFDAGDPMV
ncbi:MAG: hypothetical protein ABFE08_11090 [Armatimonadia bacterium]